MVISVGSNLKVKNGVLIDTFDTLFNKMNKAIAWTYSSEEFEKTVYTIPNPSVEKGCKIYDDFNATELSELKSVYESCISDGDRIYLRNESKDGSFKKIPQELEKVEVSFKDLLENIG